jgi:serine/threonine protein kinase/tetratricopeptide (TPR) repeat protein
MADPFQEFDGNTHSTGGLLAEWNISMGSDLDSDSQRTPAPDPPTAIQDVPRNFSRGDANQTDIRPGNPHLRIDPAPDDDITRERPDQADRSPTIRKKGPAPHRSKIPLKPTKPLSHAPSAWSGGSRAANTLPQPGEDFNGFRILLELGRGAFARVFLAEEINLGRRLVAIKVSKIEGDEPQILARLQHAHIVPVHSVSDDPESGLRILCMPYLGGANLAQVLRASGGLASSNKAGRDLLMALDHVSHAQPHLSSPNFSYGSMFASQRQSRNAPNSHSGPASSLGALWQRSASNPLVRSLLARLKSQGYGLNDPSIDPDSTPATTGPDPHQPSRQFLAKANAAQTTAWIIARLAEGLEHAHSRGLLHRDIKPSNILLTSDGTPMLLDFNLATTVEPAEKEDEFQKAAIGGTLPYMSPEHLDAFHPRGNTAPEAVCEPADIYALGLILFEMITGEPPFPSPPPGSGVVAAVEFLLEQRKNPPSLRSRAPQVPWSLNALVAKCLQFDQTKRYQHARDLAHDLRAYLEDRPMKYCPEPSARERLAKWRRRHPALTSSTSIAILSCVMLGLAGWGVYLGYGIMQDLAARVHIRLFEKDFADAQFLLNTSNDSDDHLRRGMARARDTFRRITSNDANPLEFSGWQRRLTPQEKRQLRQQILELILLDARANVLLATRKGNEADRRRAIEKAIARLDQAEASVVQAPAALYAERARYHAALGDAELAQRDRQNADRIVPVSCHDYTILGTSLLASGDRTAAEQALKAALRIDVSSFWTWFILGHCHYAEGRYLEAAADFTACTVKGPTYAWPHFNRGLALARAGRVGDAKDSYDRAIAIEPDFVEALANRALVELELNQLDAARQDLARTLSLGRYEIAVMAAMAETLARLGKPEEAERYFANLLTRDPGNSVVHVARGISRIKSNPEGAKADFSQVLAFEADNATAHYGMALLVRGTRPTDALAHLDRALNADPHLIDALQLRALVRGRLGEPATLDDVDRLIQNPTAQRLYNAACATALYAQKANQPRQLNHAINLLDRAVKSGFPPAQAASDPDLEALRGSPEFQKILEYDPRPRPKSPRSEQP